MPWSRNSSMSVERRARELWFSRKPNRDSGMCSWSVNAVAPLVGVRRRSDDARHVSHYIATSAGPASRKDAQRRGALHAGIEAATERHRQATTVTALLARSYPRRRHRTKGDHVKVKLILPALEEATDPHFRPIKYSLFPPLGLMTLAAYLAPDDEVEICDEHVDVTRTDDAPNLVAIQTYITSAHRAYELADLYRSRGSHVCLGGLHPTALPDEAALHADTVVTGPGEGAWPEFLADFRAGRPKARYHSTLRTLEGAPMPRRDLVDTSRYLVPNSLVVSRGCPHSCDFCYKESFYAGGRSFYTMPVDRALAEIEGLRGRHLYFLDDNLLADERFARELFVGMRGLKRVWQAAGHCSWGSRRWTRRRSPTRASRTTSAAITTRRSSGCTRPMLCDLP